MPKRSFIKGDKVERFREPPDEGLMSEMLWSDPQPRPGRAPSKRGVGLSFGPDVTAKFLENNNLKLVVRSHEVKDEGYEVEANGKLITVFSATNYCNRWANAGAILLVGKDLEITPKMIYPLDDLEDAWIDAPIEKAAGSSSPPAELSSSIAPRIAPSNASRSAV